MSQRRRHSRELALQFFFQKEFSDGATLVDFLSSPIIANEIEKSDESYTKELVTGTLENWDLIKSKIMALVKNWSIDRLSSIDRNILFISLYELQFSSESLAPAIVMNEWIEIAKSYGTTESAQFINGILDQAHKES